MMNLDTVKSLYFPKKWKNEWNQTQILIANDGEANDYFGNSVSISNDGNILLIGAPEATNMIILESSVSISNDGNILLIGAPHATVGNNTYEQGKAYIFQK
ncbi:hypothetical protein M0811_06423 [Anaeramoeba ignava]|uniref:Uncharacterized protein n=1 Tax=Anaeramoeba ignava TaxID=1746090 RepID=A0A9Q0RE91_ANAIG|nr:hypothetical protein M0811_06423 [Anaeramoeba ignava]